jgi:hypothetical protein
MAKRKRVNEGIGDTVHSVLKATGIDKLAKFVLGEDCGCEERRQKWNEHWRYHTPQCLNEEQYQYLKEFYDRNPTQVTSAELKSIYSIYNHVFHWKKKELTSCVECIRETIAELYKIYEDYGTDN